MSSVIRHRARSGVLAAAVVAALLLVAGCSGGSSSGGVTHLTFWSWVPTFKKAVDAFNTAHPDIQVAYTSISGPPDAYTKMRAAVKAGNAPDIATIEYQEMPAFVAGKLVQPLDDDGIDRYRSRYASWQWQQSSLGGKTYALPQGGGPLAFYYRADLFASAGIDQPPTTWAEYEADAQKIRTALPNSYIGTFDPGQPALFMALASQSGASWFRTTGGKWSVDMDGSASVRVADLWSRLVEQKLVNVESMSGTGFTTGLKDGTIAGWVCAQWCGAGIKANAPELSGKWKVAPMPQWSTTAHRSGNWGGVGWAVLKGSAKAKAATEFAAWMTSDPKGISALVASGGGWPASLAAQKTLVTADPYFGGQKVNEVFRRSDAEVDKDLSYVPTIDQTFEHWTDGAQAAVESGGRLADVLRSVQKQTVSDLSSRGYPVHR